MKILTPSGFQLFDGVARWNHGSGLRLRFEDGITVNCADKHKFVYDSREERYADAVLVGDCIGGKFVESIEYLDNSQFFYDPINVSNGSVYYHDDFIPSTQTFFGTGDTLINANTLMSLRAENPKHIEENGLLNIYADPVKGHEYVMCVDVCRGKEQDYSTFSIIDISTKPFFHAAVYRNNAISPILFPQILEKYGKLYNMAYIVIENNDQGSLTCYGLHHDLEYENLHMTNSMKSDAIGIDMNKKTKKIGCSGFKDLLENNKLHVMDENTIMEISTFERKGNSYEASSGNHDDIVMNLVLFGYFVTSPEFERLSDINIKKLMFESRIQEIEEDVPVWGYLDDGLNDQAISVEEFFDQEAAWAIPPQYSNDNW